MERDSQTPLVKVRGHCRCRCGLSQHGNKRPHLCLIKTFPHRDWGHGQAPAEFACSPAWTCHLPCPVPQPSCFRGSGNGLLLLSWLPWEPQQCHKASDLHVPTLMATTSSPSPHTQQPAAGSPGRSTGASIPTCLAQDKPSLLLLYQARHSPELPRTPSHTDNPHLPYPQVLSPLPAKHVWYLPISLWHHYHPGRGGSRENRTIGTTEPQQSRGLCLPPQSMHVGIPTSKMMMLRVRLLGGIREQWA